MENPYQAPESRVEDIATTTQELAGRGVRLGAVLLDGLIAGAIIFPIQYATGFWQIVMASARAGQTLPAGTLLLWLLIGLTVFVLIQGYPLVKDGQTWGKKAVSIKIVDMNGNKPSIGQLCIRYGISNVAGSIPWLGKPLVLVDILMIFREDRRCLHDLAASTRVMNA
jgi:uncharacterized RDD family membrane protein YckC